MLDNAGSFDKLAPILVSLGFSILAIDMPGHGLSSHYPKGQPPYMLWEGIHVIRRISKHYKWKKITLMGHSLGGILSYMYAATFPDDVEKYVSIDASGPNMCPKYLETYLRQSVDKCIEYENIDMSRHRYSYEEILEMTVESYLNTLDREESEIMMRRAISKVPGTNKYTLTRDARAKFIGLGYIDHDDGLKFATKIKCEVLNIKATNTWKFKCPQYYDMALDLVQKSARRLERHVVDGHHHVHLTDPQTVAGIIYDFLSF